MANLKSRIRNWMIASGLSRVLEFWWRLRGGQAAHVSGDLQARFKRIYADDFWRRYGGESRSGAGSSVEATSTIRAELPKMLDKLSATSLLDVGCGDFNWMKHVTLTIPYIGVDIVPEVIETNRLEYASANRRFAVIDGTRDKLPTADIVLCREVLFHLSFADAKRLIDNIRGVGARYFIATTDPAVVFNADILSGSFRDINLAIAPYDLGDPVFTIGDGDGGIQTRKLGVWKL